MVTAQRIGLFCLAIADKMVEKHSKETIWYIISIFDKIQLYQKKKEE